MISNKLVSELILTESLKMAREFAEQVGIPADEFEIADKMDTTPTKKYVHQILKWYQVIYLLYKNKVAPELQISPAYERNFRYYARTNLESWAKPNGIVMKYLDVFTKASLPEPIEKFKTVDEFKQFMEPIYQSHREKQEAKAKELIFENDKILIFRPLTKGAVCVYGFQTKWCITQEENTYYERYRVDNKLTFYFAFSKIFTKKSNPFAKMAICVSNDGNIQDGWDNTDKQYNADHVREWLIDNDVPAEAIAKMVSVPLAFAEKWSADKLRSIGLIEVGDGSYKTELNRGSPVKFTNEFFGDDGKLIFRITEANSSIIIDATQCTSLENLPDKIYGDLMLKNTSLENLEGCPKDIGRGLSIQYNGALTSLNGCPTKLNSFSCNGNTALETLEHGPKEVDWFDCSNNNLHSLIGSPSNITMFKCSNNSRITSLEGGPTHAKEYDASGCQITSIAGPLHVETLKVRECNIRTFNNPTAKIDILNMSHNPIENFEGIPTVQELILGRVNNPDTLYPIANWMPFKNIPRIVINSSHKGYFVNPDGTWVFPRGYKTRFKFLNWT